MKLTVSQAAEADPAQRHAFRADKNIVSAGPDRLLRSGARNALDRERRLAGFLCDVAILLDQETVRRLVAIEAFGQRPRYLAVRAPRAVLVEDVERHEFGIQSRFPRHRDSP